MTDTSIDIDDTQGDISGIINKSVGSFAAKSIKIKGNLVINNSTIEDLETLKKIQDLSVEINAIEKDKVTREEFNALKEGVIKITNLLEKHNADSIKAGDVQVSRTELSIKEIVLKGNEYFDKGRFFIALGYYEEAIRIDPNYAPAWGNKGNILLNLGKHNEAIECYDEVIRINPNDFLAWNNKGNALNNLGKHNEAIDYYDRAIKLNPNYAPAWDNKGVTFSNLGKYNEAIVSWTTLN
jgi:tetratricopeptide (TPR) repeat protein